MGGRTRAHYQYHVELENAGVTDNLRKSCLYCLKSRNVCVLDSEFNFLCFIVHILQTYEIADCEILKLVRNGSNPHGLVWPSSV